MAVDFAHADDGHPCTLEAKVKATDATE